MRQELRNDNVLLFSTIHWWLAKTYPNFVRARLVIELPDGQQVRLPIQACDGAEPDPEQLPWTESSTEAMTLRDSERLILAALGEQRLGVKQLAAAADYRVNPHFRGLVRNMLDRGLLDRDSNNRYRAGPNAPRGDRHI